MTHKLASSEQTVVVGGGVIGLSIAWELSQRGRQVIVLESGQIGRGASWAGAGILPASAKLGPTGSQSTADPCEQLRSLSHDLHPVWASRLLELTGIDTGFRRCGGIYLARSRGEVATLAGCETWWQAHGIEYQRLTIEELAEREPALATDSASRILAAWFLADECQIRNPRHLQALAAACRQQGVVIQESTRMQRLEFFSGHVAGVQTPSANISSEQVCICSGAWARQTLEQLGISNGIMPVRGQMVLYRCDQPPLSSVVSEGHRYLVPRCDGRLLAGSVEEEVGYAVETTEEGISQIRGWAEQVLPSLKRFPIEKTWAGLRPGSYDGLPYLGQVPGFDNLFVATGHFRSGLHLSCATAVVIANAMTAAPNEIDLHPFRVGRG